MSLYWMASLLQYVGDGPESCEKTCLVLQSVPSRIKLYNVERLTVAMAKTNRWSAQSFMRYRHSGTTNSTWSCSDISELSFTTVIHLLSRITGNLLVNTFLSIYFITNHVAKHIVVVYFFEIRLALPDIFVHCGKDLNIWSIIKIINE